MITKSAFNLTIFSILLPVIFISSCKTKTSEKTNQKNSVEIPEKKFFTIDFEKALENPHEVLLSEIADTVEYIQLEKNKESLLGGIIDAKITADYIFIRHNGTPLVTQFDRKGNFIRHIGAVGRGPKEYALSRIFSLDKENELIYIHTNWTHKIMVFNFNGEFIKTLKFNGIDRGHISWAHDSIFMGFQNIYFGNEPYVFIEYNSYGDTLQFIRNHIFWDENQTFYGYYDYWGRNKFYRLNNNLHMKSWYNDTIFSYDNESRILPKFFINLGKYKLPDKLIPEINRKPLDSDYFWTGINESQNYIFIRYGSHSGFKSHKKEKQGIVFYDKQEKTATALSNQDDNYGFINDLDGGPNFIPRYSNDSVAFCFITALDFKTRLESDAFSDNQVKFTTAKKRLTQLNIREEDNHILMIAKLK